MTFAEIAESLPRPSLELQRWGRPTAFAGCAAIFHPAAGGTGVVMAGSWGFEAFCLAKSRRILAERLSAAGYPTLRYDQPGTGDSLADGSDGLAGWTAALQAGVRHLKALSGVERVVVIAEGLGAAVAFAALEEIDGLAGFVALAPVVSGRAHLREAQALGAMIGGTIPDGVAVAGLVLPPAVAADLSGLDLRAAERSVPAAFVVARPNRGPEEALAGRLHTAQGSADLAVFADYEAAVTDPTRAEVPAATFGRIVDWLVAAVPHGPGRPRTAVAADAALAGPDFVETGVRFGPQKRLFGVLARPLAGDDGAAAVVIANAGRDPHVGWARYGVELARTLAAAGVPSLRLDLSGIGESPAPDEAGERELLYSTVHEDDLVAAADFLASIGHPDVVLAGRCSGGYASLHAAPRIAAVKAVVAINLLRVVWDPAEKVEEAILADVRPIGSVARQALDPRKLVKVLTGEIDPRNLLRRLGERAWQRLPFARAAEAGRRRQAEALVRGLADRGTAVRLVSGRDDLGLAAIEAAFGPGAGFLAALPGAGLTLVADTDHNLTPAAARAAVSAVLLDVARNASCTEPQESATSAGSGPGIDSI